MGGRHESVAHLLIRLTPQAHTTLLLMKESLLAQALASPGVTDLECAAIEDLIDRLLQPKTQSP